jgi:hypothetical protein
MMEGRIRQGESITLGGGLYYGLCLEDLVVVLWRS